MKSFKYILFLYFIGVLQDFYAQNDSLNNQNDFNVTFISDTTIYKTGENSANKSLLKKSTLNPDSKLPSDFKFNNPKSKFNKSFNTRFDFTGNLTIESFATNAQNPLALNEKLYTRIWFNPNVTLFGLPFSTDFYYTTEDNSMYNSNSFSFNFEAGELRKQLLEGFYKELNERKKIDRIRMKDIDLKKKQEQLLQNQIDSLQNRINSLEDELKNIDLQLPQRKVDFDTSGIKPEMDDSHQDSLIEKSRKLREKLEKLKNNLEGLQNKRDGIMQKKDELMALRSMDSSLVNMNQKDINNPANLKQLASSYNSKYKKIIAFASSFDRFNIGTVYPVHSEFSVMGTPVRGIDFTWNNGKLFFIVSGGKAAANDFRFFATQRPDFDRNFFAVTSGVGDPTGTSLYYTRSFFKDPSDIVHRQRINNQVNALGGTLALLDNKLKLKGEYAHSQFHASNTVPPDMVLYEFPENPYEVKPDTRRLNAFFVDGTYALFKSVELQSKVQKVNPGYKSIGNPFLRTGFYEREHGVNTKLFKDKISTKVFYKINHDNLANENTSTNKMRGYGIMVQTHFKSKYPNGSLYHSPYQHGNNHPDSLLRSFSQFSVTTASVNYSRKIKKAFMVTTTSYTKSTVTLDRLGQTGMKSIMINSSVLFPNSVQTNALWQTNITNPGVDTLNATLFSVSASKNLSKKFSVGLESHLTSFKNGAVKNGGKILTNYKPNQKITLAFAGGFDYIDKLWGFEAKKVFSARLKTIVRW